MFRSHAVVVNQLSHRRQRLLKRGKHPCQALTSPLSQHSNCLTSREANSSIRGWRVPDLSKFVVRIPLLVIFWVVSRWLLVFRCLLSKLLQCLVVWAPLLLGALHSVFAVLVPLLSVMPLCTAPGEDGGLLFCSLPSPLFVLSSGIFLCVCLRVCLFVFHCFQFFTLSWPRVSTWFCDSRSRSIGGFV